MEVMMTAESYILIENHVHAFHWINIWMILIFFYNMISLHLWEHMGKILNQYDQWTKFTDMISDEC